MTDQTSQTPAVQPSGDAYLRLLIADAVAREVTNSLAPLRNQMQVSDASIRQLNRDYGALTSNFTDLEELVRGNPRQNLLGLADQIKDAHSVITDMKTEFRQGLNRVESAVTVKLEEMQKQLNVADENRKAVINQLKGAKYAFIALGFVTGVAQYKELASVLASIFNFG